MNYFKHIRMLSLLAISYTVMLCGCKKEWLKPKPLSFYTPENTYTDPAALQDALVACERNLRYEWYGDGAPIITQLIFSDEAVDGTTDKSGPAQDMNVDITPDAITASNDNADHNRIFWYWEQSYYRIKYANTVITYIDVPKWDTTNPTQLAQRNALLGSAYFFRAYSYYELCNSFGDVPWVGKLYNYPKLDFQTVQRNVILKQLKKDLEFAVQWVPDNVPKGEVTKGACLHLLTKIDLALGDFDDAIQAATQLINSGVYHLMTQRFGQDAKDTTKNVIWDLHRPANKVLPENKEGLMYVIDLDGYQNNGDYGGGMQIMRQTLPNALYGGKILTPNGNVGMTDKRGIEYDLNTKYGRGIGRCRATWYATHEIWSNDPGDLRHAPGNWMTMEDLVYNNPALKGKDPYYGQHLQLYSSTGKLLCLDTVRDWFDWPHYKLFVPDYENTNNNGGHTPWYVFRLAETYLLRAEAYLWKGDLVDAAADINAVRARAGAPPVLPSDVTMATILNERARELYYEEPRHVELVRIAYLYAMTGKPAPNGKTYTLTNFSKDNFWYDWVIAHNEFYRNNVVTIHGDMYTLSPYHVLWPIPQSAIDANVNGHINQNQGYNGADKNVPPLDHIPQD